MGILRIMSVGKSGVGKSTIGNMILSGKGEGPFETSTSSKSCTQEPHTLKANNYLYVDVPGIPDTDPNNTAIFYDRIIDEVKKDLHVILFVFKREREDPVAYKLAEMLFREINKSNPLKILIINDQNNYAFNKQPPTEADYKEQAKTITQWTKIDFTYELSFTADTMKEKLDHLKTILSLMQSYTSIHLRNFSELSYYVDDLRKKTNYQEEVIRLEKERISRLKKQLTGLQLVAVGACSATSLATLSSFFTFGAAVGIATSTGLAAAAATATLQKKKKELEKAKKEFESISTANLDKAAKELQDACENFKDLKKALKMA